MLDMRVHNAERTDGFMRNETVNVVTPPRFPRPTA